MWTNERAQEELYQWTLALIDDMVRIGVSPESLEEVRADAEQYRDLARVLFGNTERPRLGMFGEGDRGPLVPWMPLPTWPFQTDHKGDSRAR